MTVQVGVLNGSNVVYLNKLEGHQRLRTPSKIGGRMPAYCTAVGKVLLAFNQEATEDALRSPRHAWTPNTIVAEDALRQELARVHQTGIAFDLGESLASLSCVAAPIMGRDGRPVAAMSISGDATTFRPSDYEHVLRSVCYSASRSIASHRQLTVVA
jgi:DNA-binding IclR family transcriptional regulator